jgi:hypothetical protein
VKFKEFEASTHLSMSCDDVYRIASDPSRITSWMPRELAPGSTSSSSMTKTSSSGSSSSGGSSSDSSSGVSYDAAAHRIEWETAQDHCETWLEVRASGGESDVTIHLSAPESNATAAQMQQQLEQALHRLELEANRGLNV